MIRWGRCLRQLSTRSPLARFQLSQHELSDRFKAKLDEVEKSVLRATNDRPSESPPTQTEPTPARVEPMTMSTPKPIHDKKVSFHKPIDKNAPVLKFSAADLLRNPTPATSNVAPAIKWVRLESQLTDFQEQICQRLDKLNATLSSVMVPTSAQPPTTITAPEQSQQSCKGQPTKNSPRSEPVDYRDEKTGLIVMATGLLWLFWWTYSNEIMTIYTSTVHAFPKLSFFMGWALLSYIGVVLLL